MPIIFESETHLNGNFSFYPALLQRLFQKKEIAKKRTAGGLTHSNDFSLMFNSNLSSFPFYRTFSLNKRLCSGISCICEIYWEIVSQGVRHALSLSRFNENMRNSF